MSDQVDERYYEAATPGSVSERVAVLARNRVYADFLRCCRPQASDTILDVGVSDVINDAANVLEREYAHPRQITAAGLGAGTAFRAAFPLVHYTRISANEPLPFPDKAFDIAAANAVLEHVGSRANQEAFVAELLRVAGTVFITVPHRFFPVEHHTAIPLLHFTDWTFAGACRALGKSEWAEAANLILMTRTRLRSLVPPGIMATVAFTGLRLGPFSSNLLLALGERLADHR